MLSLGGTKVLKRDTGVLATIAGCMSSWCSTAPSSKAAVLVPVIARRAHRATQEGHR